MLLKSIEIIGTASNSTSFAFATGLLAQTEGTGNGGSLEVKTEVLTVKDGASISVATFGKGNAGNLSVRANSISLDGTSTTSRSGLLANAIEETGNGGNINIFTNELTVSNEATVSASNFQTRGTRPPGLGSPGNININANNILLSNEGNITVETVSGNEGKYHY